MLYSESRNTVLGVRQQEIELVNTTPETESQERTAWFSAQTTAPWLFYQPRGYDTRLKSSEFRLSMASAAARCPPICCHPAPRPARAPTWR